MTLQKEVLDLLDRPNFVHFATLLPDGSPVIAPVWAGLEGDRILICAASNSLKAKNVKRDPRVAISVVDFHNPYEEAQIRGRVVEIRDDSSLRILDAIARKYSGKPYPERDGNGTIALVIEVEKAKYSKLPFEYTPPDVEPV
jgi:PPOX class probable F420-dependent enzyme